MVIARGNRVAPQPGERDRELVMSSWIDVVDWEQATSRILAWAEAREQRTVCLCNVHSVVTADADPALRDAINSADLAAPDGHPVAWLLGRRRRRPQPRVNGPDLTVKLCQLAAARDLPIAFYGSTEDSLARLREALASQFPRLRVVATISPPFRALSASELDAYGAQLAGSGAALVFIGLGCPKQEIWMAANRAKVGAVLLGVGAAFEFLAGTVRRPPVWMRRLGLEWLGRLLAEPRRLWRRYLVTNTLYIAYLAREFLFKKRPHGPNRDV
ncbi:MAG: WecB/TagA/CpsF family glycosyltransferase [Gammaproteobacteria bacterium]|nr:WecB/TagA/CpsF family glycosyltransferase [Gammaproteobacteria bacterium]